MLIQNFKTYYFNNYAAQKNNAVNKEAAQNSQRAGNSNLMSYPANYYFPISFGRRQLSHFEIIDRIGRENFPSPVIAERFEAEKNKSLYEVHKEYYADLLNCKTLDETKELYPEFEDVIDAKDVNLDELAGNHILRRINRGQVNNITLKNLTLELLKKRYAEVISANYRECYYNMSPATVNKLFRMLNIKKLNDNYHYNLFSSNPDVRERYSQGLKKAWERDDGTRREKCALAAAERFNTPEARAKNLASRRTPEAWRRKSKAQRAFYQSEKGQLHIKARKEAWESHPEITEAMSKVAKEFPMVKTILAKIKRGEEISKDEQIIYAVYLKKCEEAVQNYHQIIADAFKEILNERGLKN